jgi:hypothetical protein
VSVGVAALLLIPASVAIATPSSAVSSSGASHGHSTGEAKRAAHGHQADPSHVDPAPAGVNVRAKVATATIIARAGVRKRPAKLKRVTRATTSTTQGSRTAADTAVATTVLDVPAGVPGNPALTQHVSPSCTGDGTDGNRVQVLYAYEAGQTNRLPTILTSLQSYVADIDDTFALSSPNGNRRVRWVSTPTCVPDIKAVELPVGSFADQVNFGLDAIATAAETAGIKIDNRKLLTFADANYLCGIGEIYPDDTAASTNTNNVDIPMVARVDTGCWSMAVTYHSTPAHELMHMLGGVQESAPHSTTYGHCTDEHDVMCYEDGGTDRFGAYAVMQDVCHDTATERLFDCGRDDYYNAGTPASGSYLATHWNTARSSYLDIVTTSEVSEPALTATISGGTSLRPGLATTYVVTPNVPASVVWSASAPACLLGSTTSTSVVVQCPSSYSGSLRLTATVTTADGQSLTTNRLVPLTGPAAALTVVLSAPTKVYVGYPTPISTLVKYGRTPVRAVISLQQYTSVNGVRAWRTFATTTSSTTGTARFTGPASRSAGPRYYRAVVTVGSGSGWTSNVSLTRRTDGVLRTTVASSARSARPDVVTGVLRTSSGAALRSQYVTLQYHYSGSSRWVNLTRRVTSGSGVVTASVQPRRLTYYRWVYGGSSVYGSAVSAIRYVRY